MVWKVVVPLLAALVAVGLGGLAGGWRDVTDFNDAGVQNALRFAVVQHNKDRNDMYLSQAGEVVKVEKQVVAGMNYRITVNMGKTPCRQGSAIEDCAIHQNQTLARPYQCTFTVYNRPWDSFIKLTKQQC